MQPGRTTGNGICPPVKGEIIYKGKPESGKLQLNILLFRVVSLFRLIGHPVLRKFLGQVHACRAFACKGYTIPVQYQSDSLKVEPYHVCIGRHLLSRRHHPPFNGQEKQLKGKAFTCRTAATGVTGGDDSLSVLNLEIIQSDDKIIKVYPDKHLFGNLHITTCPERQSLPVEARRIDNKCKEGIFGAGRQ